jgi:hypothetical protein
MKTSYFISCLTAIVILFSHQLCNAKISFHLNEGIQMLYLDTIPKSKIIVRGGDTTEIVQVPTKEQQKYIPAISTLRVPMDIKNELPFGVAFSDDKKTAFWSDDPMGEVLGDIKTEGCAEIDIYYLVISTDIENPQLVLLCSDVDGRRLGWGPQREIPNK